MWTSKGYVRTLGLVFLIVGQFMTGHPLDLSSLPEILQAIGLPIGLLGIINAMLPTKK
jgi:hypothetical protein